MRRPLDVLFLTQTYPRGAHDSSGPFIRDLARALVDGGDRVRVLAPHAKGLPPSWSERGVDVATFRYAPERFESFGYGRSLRADERVKATAGLVAPLYLLAARRAVRRELARGACDLVQGHWIVPNGLVASRFASRAAIAIGLHGSDVFLAEKPGVRRLARRALASADVLTGCSPELVDRTFALGFPRDRSRVIPYGVDVELFRPDPARRKIWRERLRIPDAAPLLLGVGRMATKKGFQVLLDALPGLVARNSEIRVVLAGGGDRLEEFRERAKAFEGRLLLPGAVLHDELPDLYRAADLFVLPAVHDAKGNVDGLPNVILEAMASGLAVVASAVSGIPLAVAAGKTGWLVPEGDREALSGALGEALADRARLAELGRAARARAEKEFVWYVIGERYREAYLLGLEHRELRKQEND